MKQRNSTLLQKVVFYFTVDVSFPTKAGNSNRIVFFFWGVGGLLSSDGNLRSQRGNLEAVTRAERGGA